MKMTQPQTQSEIQAGKLEMELVNDEANAEIRAATLETQTAELDTEVAKLKTKAAKLEIEAAELKSQKGKNKADAEVCAAKLETQVSELAAVKDQMVAMERKKDADMFRPKAAVATALPLRFQTKSNIHCAIRNCYSMQAFLRLFSLIIH